MNSISNGQFVNSISNAMVNGLCVQVRESSEDQMKLLGAQSSKSLRMIGFLKSA